MKSSSLTTLICFDVSTQHAQHYSPFKSLEYTAIPHTSLSCHSVITQRGSLNLPVSLVSLPSHTSQLAVDPLFLSGPEYHWMTVLPKKPHLPLTNLAAALFCLICSHCLPLGLCSHPSVSAGFYSSDLQGFFLSFYTLSINHFLCSRFSWVKVAKACLVTQTLWHNTGYKQQLE